MVDLKAFDDIPTLPTNPAIISF